MGPWNEERQIERAEAILALLNDPTISAEARRIWENHLNSLAETGEAYVVRAQRVYAHALPESDLNILKEALS